MSSYFERRKYDELLYRESFSWCPHLKHAHPVPGARLESGGVAAGDRGERRVGVRGVGEQHLGEDACCGHRRLFVALHAATGKYVNTEDETECDVTACDSKQLQCFCISFRLHVVVAHI